MAMVVNPMSEFHAWLSKISTEEMERRRHFKGWIRADRTTVYAPKRMRYRLLVSRACVESHRALMVLSLKGLDDVIPVVNMNPILNEEKGWMLPRAEIGFPENAESLKDLYCISNEEGKEMPYIGSVTVPAIWDTDTQRIINNKTHDICLMLNSEFNEFTGPNSLDLYPEGHREAIDQVTEEIESKLCSNIYLCGFVTIQRSYDASVDELFEHLWSLERRCGHTGFLIARDLVTLADLALFAVLVRMETIYYPLMKCNRRHLWSFPNLLDFTQGFYQTEEIRKTVDLNETKVHYMKSYPSLNPSRVVSDGPDTDFLEKVDAAGVPLNK